MIEQLPTVLIGQNPDTLPKQELKTDRNDLMEAKKQRLGEIKDSVREIFGTEELPKELVMEMLQIRKEIKGKIDADEYVDVIDESTNDAIRLLMLKIVHYGKDIGEVENMSEDEEAALKVNFKDGTSRQMETSEKELLESLENYFESYKLAHNTAKFRKNIGELQDAMSQENKSRRLNFYSKGEKKEVLVEKMYEKYQQAGFEKEEIKELVNTCNLEKLDNLEIHDIKIIRKTIDTFSRFMKGDKSKYIGLSAALMVPAFLDGYAPIFLADAFKGGQMGAEQLTQVGLYALLSAASAGSSVLISKHFKDFLDNNFKKEEGYSDYISESASEFPGDEVGKFGMEAIKRRIANAKNSYEEVLRMVSFDILPAAVTLMTSAVMLYEKSPILAGGTAAGTGLMMVVDNYVTKKGKFWEKERKAEKEAEKMNQKMEELLNAHMEVVLSGEKERFSQEMDEMLSKERVAMSDRTFLGVIREKINHSFGVINFVIASLVTYLSGGASDKFVAALVYSGNFQEGISTLLRSKRRLLSAYRDIMQMDLMFNGYAEEEREKEKDRTGMSEIKSNDISLRGVGVEFDEKKILENIDLEIPGGSLVSLQGISGAGKTTLMKVLAGYYKPTSGSVEIGGVEMGQVKKSGGDSIFSKIAYLSQFPYILEDTVSKNLTFGISGEVTDEEIKEVLKEVGLDERFRNLNEKLKGGRGDMGTTSGGETSRIGLARAILKMRKNHSRIVFLDEPTASVDEETSIKIADIINMEKKKNPEVTFISISHDKNFNDNLESSMSIKMEKGNVESS
jgi:ABC-type multidrug transport system fused ATPase/permease subunit